MQHVTLVILPTTTEKGASGGGEKGEENRKLCVITNQRPLGSPTALPPPPPNGISERGKDRRRRRSMRCARVRATLPPSDERPRRLRHIAASRSFTEGGGGGTISSVHHRLFRSLTAVPPQKRRWVRDRPKRLSSSVRVCMRKRPTCKICTPIEAAR